MKLSLFSPVALTAASVLVALNAQAQIYRTIDAQGHVTFTDTPGTATEAIAPGRGSAADSARAAELPYALRQVQARYPVTLYAGPQCTPCDLGRSLLTDRGIPFVEKTVANSEDVAALRQLANTTELPVLTLGGRQLKGYEQTTWTRYLDAAGYPETSRLPTRWKAAAPTPLATPAPDDTGPDTTATAVESETSPSAAPASDFTRPQATADNPAGIRF